MDRLMFSTLLLGILYYSVLGCDRNSEQIMPSAKTEAERQKAQDFPSTRNAENPDPSIGGTNSATSRSDAPVPGGSPTSNSSTPDRSRDASR